jgi:N-methylhydantoinase A
VTAKRYGLGVDIGGTFTDLVLYDGEGGGQFSHKQLTTHSDPAKGVIAGLSHVIAEHRIDPAAVGRVVHATTLFTNALIERKGAMTGLITTQGFRDTLEIGRERKYELYDIHITKPKPLVPRRLRLEVPERLDHRGVIITPLDESALIQAARNLAAQGVTSLAIVFLHSYANAVHEWRALELLRHHFPDLALSASVDVAPEIREYERTSTTVCNAYIKPLAERYLTSLMQRIAGLGISAPLLLMLSNGGLTHVDEAKRSPVQLLESGPAAGALVAAHFAGRSGHPHVLAYDMGGTTAKLSIVDDGRPTVAYSFEAAREKRFIEGSGLPVRISTLDLIEIGAGGGSIAHLDEIGLLKVGPASAGSEPGPAAYGLGGTKPTVTDADFVLGYLDPAYFAGGRMPIDMPAARRALSALAGRASLNEMQLAWGVHDLVNENMANAARVHIAEHGKDPRRYALLATGGAGPLHAFYVAKKLGLSEIIVPPSAGVASALGLLIAPARVDRVATVARELGQIDWPTLEGAFARLEADARHVLDATGLRSGTAGLERRADMRYVGQASELVVPLPAGPYSSRSHDALFDAFQKAYVAAFTRTPPSTPIEIINIRVTGTMEVSAAPSASTGSEGDLLANPLKGTRPAYFPEHRELRQVNVFDRYKLKPSQIFDGPAIIEERESTLVVGPGGRFRVLADGSIVVNLG